MPESVDIPLCDLLLDERNARLRDEQPGQPATILALAQASGRRLISQAEHLVLHGLDPLSLPGVVKSESMRGKYVVIEGNRRILALKALETPPLVLSGLEGALRTRLNALSKQFAVKPIRTIRCVLFESEQEMHKWVTLRHTGMNEGVGLVPWTSDDKDRYLARHGKRSPAGQIIDFVAEHGGDKGIQLAKSQTARGGYITSLTRLVSNPVVRDRLGIQVTDGEVRSWYPMTQVAKSLLRIVEDLATQSVKVKNIYEAEQRRQYARDFPRAARPKLSTRLPAPVSLAALPAVTPRAATRNTRTRRELRRPDPPERATLIPKDCRLKVGPNRIHAIYVEGLRLDVNQFRNAASVLLRVFVELSVDHYLMEHGLIKEETRRSLPLAKRMKQAASELRKRKSIDEGLKLAVEKAADSGLILAASCVTMNQYVHNKYVYPQPMELRLTWDELQPFMEQLWP